MPSFDIHPIDIAILLSYVLGTRIVLGWWFARKTKQQGAEGYFLAGRGMRWPIIGLSFYVANMSGSTFIALPGSGYLDGIAVYNYEWVPALLLVFFAVYLLPLFLRGRLYTAPQFLERRFGRSTQLAFAAFLLVANIFIDAAAGLYAGAMIGQVLLPEIPLWVIIAATSLVAGLYIAFGGLGAVVYNDAIQAALIIGGGATISWLAFQEVGSWEAIRSAAPEQALHLIRPADDELMPWPGLFTGVLVIGFYFWCTNQFVIQRAFATLALGVSLGVVTWAGNEILGWWEIQFLYAAGLMLVVSALILVSVSLVSVGLGSQPPSSEQQDCCTRALNPWGRAAKAERVAHSDERWSISERWMGLLLIALTVFMVAWWH